MDDDTYYHIEEEDHAEAIETETRAYSLDERVQMYLEELAIDQNIGYYYDDQGNLITGIEQGDSSTKAFDHPPCESPSQDGNDTPFDESTTTKTDAGSFQGKNGLDLPRKDPALTTSQVEGLPWKSRK